MATTSPMSSLRRNTIETKPTTTRPDMGS